MKKIYLLLTYVLLTMGGITSCKTAPDDPKSVAKGFTEALMNDDFGDAGHYATKESQATLEMLKTASQMEDKSDNKGSMNMMKEAKGKTVTYSDAKMEGTERAIVSVMADGKEVLPLILKKVEGSWKVAFDIASIMDGERLNIKENPVPVTEPDDSFITNLGTMNDSINDAYNKARKDLDTSKTDAPDQH